MRPHLDPSHLLTRFCAGFRPRLERKLGLEYEMVGVLVENGRAVPYQGSESSVVNVLRQLRDKRGWRGVGDEPLLELVRHGSRVTLEPGAQIELSGRPHARLADAESELAGYLAELRGVSDELGIEWLPVGMQPITTPDEITIIPKERYRVMTAYLPTRGELALWMMRVTAGMQLNLDVQSSEEAASMLRLALALGPVFTALFANSPLAGGEPNGWMSRRARIWRETDPDRCGLPESCLDPSATICEYGDWAMDAPMFFVQREDGLHDMAGEDFRAFMEHGARGLEPRIEDWDLHLSTLFPESRLKSYLELRCVDANRFEMAMAFSALAAGVFYASDPLRTRAWQLVEGWHYDQRIAFLEDVARSGLQARAPSGATALQMADQLVSIADEGLEEFDPEARSYLDPVRAVVASGKPPAQALLDLWKGDWQSSREGLIRHLTANEPR